MTPSGGTEHPTALALAWLHPRNDGPLIELGRARAGELSIGRDADCNVVLEGVDVSRRHALLRAEGALCLLVDQSSRNGTFVNGKAVRSVVLEANDVVRIGGWLGVVTGEPGALGSIAPGLYGGRVLRRALWPAERAARSDLLILLEGETGTGKEAVARAIHAWSGRGGPFVAVNCAALPESLAEGELFGYRRGAFTGADQASLGYFRAAQRGTLLLDEVCELPLPLQAKLLRVLEQREVQPLGEATPVKLDVRVLAAAQEPLGQAVRAGRFRADLYARLDGVGLRLPPLRERRAEIPYLFERRFLEESGGQPPQVDVRVIERLCLYDWPFNVRELAVLVKRLLVLYGSETRLVVSHLPESLQRTERAKEAQAAANPSAEAPALADLLEALRASGGNVARAAQLLGISRQRAYRMMQGRAEVDLEALRERGEEP